MSNPINLSLSGRSGSETAPLGTVIGVLSATDPENGPVTYTLPAAQNPGGFFKIVGNQLQIAKGLDYETLASHTVTVEAKDADGNATTQTFTIDVQDETTPRSSINIDASGTGGVNISDFINGFFPATGNTYNFYNGDQVYFGVKISGQQLVFKNGNKVVILEGDSFNAIAYNPNAGHSISGSVTRIMFGDATNATVDPTTNLLTGVTSLISITGLGISGTVGQTNTELHQLFTTIRSGNMSVLNGIMDDYGQKFSGSAGNDIFGGSEFNDTISGNSGTDVLDGRAGHDVLTLSGNRSDYSIVSNSDGSLSITGAGGTTTAHNVEAFTFSDGTIAAENAIEQQGFITIDASGSGGMDFEAFVRGGFLIGVTGGGFPVFDNTQNQFFGEEMFVGYGNEPTSKYVLAQGDLQYAFGTHTVAGTIKTIEYATRGTGSYDSNGHFVGGTALLRIIGLNLSNPVPDASTEAEIEASGPVHNFSVAHMNGLGNPTTAARLALYADSLDKYAQNFLGSSGADVYIGTKFNDTISGGGGKDRIFASKGNDTIDGGNESDTVVYGGSRADYVVARQSDGSYTVAYAGGGTQTLWNVETVLFDNHKIDLVTGAETPVGAPPAGIELSNARVSEDVSVGKLVGTFSAVDPEGKVLDYTLMDNADGLFTLVGGELRVNNALDFEKTPTHTVGLQVTDADGHTVTKSFKITVDDVNEAPVDISISKAVVGETAEIGTRVGGLSAVDPEGGAVRFRLASNPGGVFKLDGSKLVLNKELDFEKAPSHSIIIEAKDAAGLITRQKLQIAVTDVMESKSGSSSNDALLGGKGKDKLSGGDGQDYLVGNLGDDRLYGGSGDDRLHGGMGADDLYGGAGGDCFIFKSLKHSGTSRSTWDSIFDFSTKQKDKIDLSAIDANTLKAGNQAFSYVGKKDFSGKAGELRHDKAKSDTYIYGDVNGDRVADLTIHLDDAVSLSKSYFVL